MVIDNYCEEVVKRLIIDRFSEGSYLERMESD